MGEVQLFDFADEEISKLENTIFEDLLKPENTNININFVDLDNIDKIPITPDIIQKLYKNLENNIYNQDQKTKVLDILKKQVNNLNPSKINS